ncbi:MAG: YicC/YloC family endoribonuclease [Methylococcaceae bacterium]
MTHSMTAFASREREIAGQIFVWDIRSVNHRYLDIALKMPDQFRFMESDVRKLIGQSLKRGRVDCSLQYRKNTGAETTGFALNINRERLECLMKTLADIEREYPRSWQAISPMEVLNWPGVLQQTQTEYESLAAELLTVLQEALDKAVEVRSGEGRQLAGFMEERCQTISTLARDTRVRIPAVLLEIKQKIRQRLLDLSTSPDPDRLEQEMVYLAQRLDVTEELDRIETHVLEIFRVLKQAEPAGRQLDFLIQELNREANTLASKSQDSTTTKAAVEMKVLIEQIREQAQNLE